MPNNYRYYILDCQLSYIYWYFFDKRVIYIFAVLQKVVFILSLENRKQVWHLLYHHWRSGEVRGLHKLRHAKNQKHWPISHVTVSSHLLSNLLPLLGSGGVNGGMCLKLVNGFSENFRHTFLSLYFVDGLTSNHIFCSLHGNPIHSFPFLKKMLGK